MLRKCRKRPQRKYLVMEITWAQIEEIAEKAAIKAVELYKSNEPKPVFKTKTAIAEHLKCDRRTVTAMIERNEIIITPQNQYKLN